MQNFQNVSWGERLLAGACRRGGGGSLARYYMQVSPASGGGHAGSRGFSIIFSCSPMSGRWRNVAPLIHFYRLPARHCLSRNHLAHRREQRAACAPGLTFAAVHSWANLPHPSSNGWWRRAMWQWLAKPNPILHTSSKGNLTIYLKDSYAF